MMLIICIEVFISIKKGVLSDGVDGSALIGLTSGSS